MNLHDAIAGRRTIKEFKSDAVPDELIERALEAGTWAQNHRLTEPWRFTFVGPQTREKLSAALPKTAAKPVVIAVSTVCSDGAAQEREDIEAVACAIQNIALAAWALGLGMQWSSGPATTLPSTYELLRIDAATEEIVGLLYFGFPATVPPAKPRKSVAEVSRRLP